jgi:alpha-D-ribose 1-methylphosphonate 5-phosphate C-P lyase
MTDVPPPPDPRDEPYYDPRRRDDRDGGHGWQLVAVGLIALIIGVGATYLIKDDGGDIETQVRTVQRESQTVTVEATPSATEAVTVTQPPAETVTRTTTLTVTVPTVPETATEP